MNEIERAFAVLAYSNLNWGRLNLYQLNSCCCFVIQDPAQDLDHDHPKDDIVKGGAELTTNLLAHRACLMLVEHIQNN